MENSHTQFHGPATAGEENAAFIIDDGCINYFFPFSFLKHQVVQEIRGHLHQLSDPKKYRRLIVETIRQLCCQIPEILFGLTWLPSAGWSFSPWKFVIGDDLTQMYCQTLIKEHPQEAVENEDLTALAANDGFFYLSEYLRRQPIVRLRLSDPVVVVREAGLSPLINTVHVDLTLHLALGQGCLIFRHIVNNLSVDDLIGIRLTQFRRGMAFRWIEAGSNNAEPRELQDLYFSIGQKVFDSAFVPTYDVRQYAAVLELRKVRRGKRLLDFSAIKESNPKWLYGLLNVDERWRDIDQGRAIESLSKAISHTERYRQYCQSVSLLVLHSTERINPYPFPITPNTLDLYYWNLRSNLRRTVADRACVMEALMAQENLLVNMYEDYRGQIWTQTPSRATTQRLRKALIVSRQEADESFNILPGEELLTEVRGLSRWRLRIQEASATLDMVLEEYHKYQNELLEDIGSSTGVGVSVFSILFSLGTVVTTSSRWGVTVALGFLAFSRWYKYKDRLAIVLIVIWIMVVLFFWIVLDMLKLGG